MVGDLVIQAFRCFFLSFFDICLHLHLYLDCFDRLFHFPKNEVELNFQFFQLHLSFTSLGGFVRFVSLSPNIHSMNQSFKWQLPKNCGRAGSTGRAARMHHVLLLGRRFLLIFGLCEKRRCTRFPHRESCFFATFKNTKNSAF